MAQDQRPIIEAQLSTPPAGAAATDTAAPQTQPYLDPFDSSGVAHGSPLSVRIGHYLIIREIAMGGMATVYEALQDQPRRVVALKLLRVGWRAPAAQRRFEFESQLLARLRHPNIAQVYEAGTHAHGETRVPYFAMELIPAAKSITAYAAERKLSPAQCMELFIKVCDAVHYANTKGIVHRDLKPGNILVDLQGVPKVIDFGVARAADSDQFSPTLQTNAGQLIGTLQYMSPEQCDIDPRELDARSDVYSLGVILYELLCGELPYDLTKANVSDATRIVREQPPRKPSQINPALAGDIETVLIKALHKDRDRRYQTADALAADLRHVLADEPIDARRDSTIYVLRTRIYRKIRQHRILAILLIVLLSLVVAETIGTLANESLGSNRHFERIVTSYLPMSQSTSPTAHGLRHVRIIALHDGTNVDELARGFTLNGVSASAPRSLRRLHGAFMNMLVEKGVDIPVLSWDIIFREPSEFDQDFVGAARRLLQRGTDVIVAAPSWSATPAHDKPLSPLIKQAVKSGSARAHCSAIEPWQIDLFVWRPKSGLPPQLSFSFATAAAYRHPMAETTLQIEGGFQFTDVFYALSDGSTTRERVRVSSFVKLPQDIPGDDLSEDDFAAPYVLSIPSNQLLDAATLDYAEVLRMSRDELRKRVNGCAVIVADYRLKDAPAAPDYSPHPDGRLLPRCVVHAVAVETLLESSPIRRPQYVSLFRIAIDGKYLLDLAGVSVGLAAGIYLARRAGRRVLIELITIAAALLFSVLVYRQARALYNPLVAIVGTVLTAEWIALAERIRTGAVARAGVATSSREGDAT